MGHCYKSDRCILKDYHRHHVSNEVYPGLIKQEGGSVERILYYGLSFEHIAILDFFEGEEYHGIQVEVEESQIKRKQKD